MVSVPHIVADISANGFGHLAQMAPILDCLAGDREIRITLRTEVDPAICRQFLQIPFEFGPAPNDPNMRMKGPLDVDSDGLFEDYKVLFNEWDEVVSRDAQILKELRADVVLTNIAVLSVASAKAASLPVAAICSLNWADVFATYCGTSGVAGHICNHMKQTYDKATKFIKLSPHMEMGWLSDCCSVGPIARQGRDIRNELERLKPSPHYVLASMGGIPGMHDMIPLPELDDVVWIVPPNWDDLRTDWLSRGNINVPFIDLMRSADLLVTKAGYGSVTECAVNSTRLIYTERSGWCENPVLEKWIKDNCTACKVNRDTMQLGNYGERLRWLLSEPIRSPFTCSGAGQAAAIISKLF